jgi:hypothetical protein
MLGSSSEALWWQLGTWGKFMSAQELSIQKLSMQGSAEDSAAQESVAQESAAQESAAQESVAQESVAQESAAQESAAQESVAQESSRIQIDSAATQYAGNSFSSSYWLWYFRSNKEDRVAITFPKSMTADVAESLRLPLIRSLQRFQIGETGEGKHLRKIASLTNDPMYGECIDLFIKEEQYHARVLAEMIQAIDGTLLSWHWTDVALIVLRRMLGLKTEIFILLIAEIIGKCFYRACACSLDNRLMSDAFSLIVLDEIGHLEFHCSFLHDQVKAFPHAFRRFIHYSWSVFFFAACLVFIADHLKSLRALKVSPEEFLGECSKSFHRASRRAFSG